MPDESPSSPPPSPRLIDGDLTALGREWDAVESLQARIEALAIEQREHEDRRDKLNAACVRAVRKQPALSVVRASDGRHWQLIHDRMARVPLVDATELVTGDGEAPSEPATPRHGQYCLCAKCNRYRDPRVATLPGLPHRSYQGI